MNSENAKEIFEHIPEGWGCKRLVDCTTDGNISYGIVQPGQHTEDGIPIIRINNINNGQLLLDDVLKVTPRIEEKHKRTRLVGGEVLLTLVGSTGQSFVAPDRLAGWNVPRAIAVIRPKKEIGADWINICLQSKPVQHFLDVRANTTVQKTLNLKDVRDLPIPIPPKEVKKGIESIAMSLQGKIALNRQINQTLEQIAQTIFKSWFVDFEPVKAKIQAKQNGEDPEHAAMRSISGKTNEQLDQLSEKQRQQIATTATLFPGELEDSELGELPKGWGHFKMIELVKQIKPGTNYQPERQEIGIPFVNGKHVQNGFLDFTKEIKYITTEEYERVHKNWKPEKNDVVITRIGTLGRVGVITEYDVPMALHYNSIDIKEDVLTHQFIYFLLKSNYFQTQYHLYKKQAVQEFVTIEAVENIEVILPANRDDLKVFMSKFEAIFSSIKLNHFQNKTLVGLRDSLLPKLLSGEIILGDAHSVAEAVA